MADGVRAYYLQHSCVITVSVDHSAKYAFGFLICIGMISPIEKTYNRFLREVLNDNISFR